jgi:hypothetical protein
MKTVHFDWFLNKNQYFRVKVRFSGNGLGEEAAGDGTDGELNSSLSGSARFTLPLADYGQQTLNGV